MQQDERGLLLGTDSMNAVRAYDIATRRALEYRPDAADHLAAAMAADPDFAMPHVLKGLFLLGFQSTRVLDQVRQCIAAAQERARGLTPREEASIAALQAMADGNKETAIGIWDDILVDHPTDLMALRQMTHALFWTGQSYGLRDAPARVLDAWDESVPGFGFVLGMYAFGLEESGDYAKAEEVGRRAEALNPDDLWAVHAVAHVLEMQGRLEDGIEWLEPRSGRWAGRNPFRGHLWWHLALFAWEAGDHDRVLDLYDRRVREDRSDFYIEIQNASSLLWRLEFAGIDVGDRWKELADTCESRIGDHGLAFTETHAILALARGGRWAAVERMLDSLRAFEGRGHNAAAATQAVQTPVCEAIVAFGRGAYDRTVEVLKPVRRRYQAMGASHAQRDIFAQILIEAALRAGRDNLARRLLAERVALKPRSSLSRAKYAGVLERIAER